MRLCYKNAFLLCVLLFAGCGTTYQSGERITARSTNPYFELGNIHLKQKQYHKAIEQYRQALRIHPDSAMIHVALGWTYYNVGMFDAAIAEGEEVMRLEPNHPDVPKLMELLQQLRNRRR